MSRRKYDDESKRDAVELLVGGGKELKPLALTKSGLSTTPFFPAYREGVNAGRAEDETD